MSAPRLFLSSSEASSLWERFGSSVTEVVEIWNEGENDLEGLLPTHSLSYLFKETVLPLDVTTHHLLPWLSPGDLSTVTDLLDSKSITEVNEGLAQTAYSLETIPGVTVIDREVWERCFGKDALAAEGISFEGAPSLTLEMIREVQRLRLSNIVEGNEGWTVLELPEGLSLNKLLRLAAHPEAGTPVGFRYIYPRVLEEHGDSLVNRTYRVVISNSVLTGSRNETVAGQEDLVAREGCEMPGVIEAITLCFLRYISSALGATPVRTYGDDPFSYTRCKEAVDNYRLIVGGFAPGGLCVNCHVDVSDGIGVAGLRKF